MTVKIRYWSSSNLITPDEKLSMELVAQAVTIILFFGRSSCRKNILHFALDDLVTVGKHREKKTGLKAQAIGASRGGKNTKIHVVLIDE